MMPRVIFCFIVLVVFPCFSAMAASHAITTGAGISAPAALRANEDNPAGILFNRKLSFLAGANTDNQKFNPFSGMFRTGMGTGSAAADLGVHTYKHDSTTRAAVDYGFGAYASSIGTAIGFSGSSHLIKDVPGGQDSHQINAGLLMNPGGAFQVGANAIGLLSGVDFMGAGFTYEFSKGLLLGTDMSTNPHMKGTSVMPALGFHFAEFLLSAGYGFKLNDQAESWIHKKWTAELGLPLGQGLTLEASYQHHSRYFVGLEAQI